MTDKQAEFTEWQWNGWSNIGMRHKESGKRYGVVRRITDKGDIGEGTFKDGKCHGLNREINYRSRPSLGVDQTAGIKVTIELRKEGSRLAHFSFDYNFQEIERKDEKGLLRKLTPQDFMLS